MNSKKLIVIVLFVLTVLIGALTIYLAVVLTRKGNLNTTPVPTPYIYFSPTPTETGTPEISPTEPGPSGTPGATVSTTPGTSVTVTPTPTPAASACGADCTTTACSDGNTCLLVNGSKKCVADICLDKSVNPAVTNSECNGDLCTSKYSITISKTAKVSCVSGQNQRTISFTIKIINPAGNNSTRNNVSVQDDLTNGLDVKYLRSGSISGSGTVNGKIINWSSLSLTPSGGFLEMKYDMVVPPAEYGNKYTNTVTVQEGGVTRGTLVYNLDISVLPCTALSKDDYLFITLGIFMVIFGMLFFRFNWHEDLGELFWNNGGARIDKNVTRFSVTIKKILASIKFKLRNKRLDLIQDKVTSFERRVSDRSKSDH